MAKFLVALDGSISFTRDLFEFSSNLLEDSDDGLFVGMVVKDVSYYNTVSSFVGDAVLADVMPQRGFLNDEDNVITDVISQFETNAKDSSVRYEIYNDFRLTTHELVKQSTNADLLI